MTNWRPVRFSQKASASGQRPTRWKTSGEPQAGSPSSFTSPWLGASWPAASLRNVDLPAPFGPRRPVTPGGDRDGHVVERDHGPVPARGPHELEGRAHVTISTARTRARSTARQATAISTSMIGGYASGIGVAPPRDPEEQVADQAQVVLQRQHVGLGPVGDVDEHAAHDLEPDEEARRRRGPPRARCGSRAETARASRLTERAIRKRVERRSPGRSRPGSHFSEQLGGEGRGRSGRARGPGGG